MPGQPAGRGRARPDGTGGTNGADGCGGGPSRRPPRRRAAGTAVLAGGSVRWCGAARGGRCADGARRRTAGALRRAARAGPRRRRRMWLGLLAAILVIVAGRGGCRHLPAGLRGDLPGAAARRRRDRQGPQHRVPVRLEGGGALRPQRLLRQGHGVPAGPDDRQPEARAPPSSCTSPTGRSRPSCPTWSVRTRRRPSSCITVGRAHGRRHHAAVRRDGAGRCRHVVDGRAARRCTPGTEVTKGTPIDLVVSQGPQPRTISPKLVGQPVDAVDRPAPAARARRRTACQTCSATTSPAGAVMITDPPGGQAGRRGARP